MVSGRPEKAPHPAGRDLGTSPTPATADHGTAHHIVTPADFAGAMRDRANRLVDNGEMTTIGADYHYQMATFCQAKNCFPLIKTEQRTWFGFGTFDVLFVNADDEGIWLSLVDAHHISGMDYDDIWQMFLDDRADGYDDMYELAWLVNDDGDQNVIPLVQHSFLMRAMLQGPWAKEYMDNTMNLFRGPLGGAL